MRARTLIAYAFPVVLGLAACNEADTSAAADPGLPDPTGWRLASGKVPSSAEFTAIAATCQAKGGAVDPCLADLGLKRAP